MKKVGEVKAKGNHLVIKYDERKAVCPYIIYRQFSDIGADGLHHNHSIMLTAFDKLSSAVQYVGQLFSWTE